MPIPGIAEDRWWIELAGTHPELAAQFQPAILSVLAFDPCAEPRVAGSAFITAFGSGFAIALPARHVFPDYVSAIQEPWERRARSALPEFVPPRLSKGIRDSREWGLVWQSGDTGDLLVPRHASFNDSTDIAALVVSPQPHARFAPANVPLDLNTPRGGEVVVMVSMDFHDSWMDAPPGGPDREGHQFSVARRMSIRMGVVTGVYPEGLRQNRWPCFTTSIPAPAGMSGGLVSVWRRTGKASACGVVSRDWSESPARLDQRVCGESIIASTWPALALQAPDAIPATSATPTLTLYDMARGGRMAVDEHSDISQFDVQRIGHQGFRIVRASGGAAPDSGSPG